MNLFSMVSDPSLVADEPNVIVDREPDDGLHPNKKGQVKVPKRIHKAEREKLKRDQLNELFVELVDVLDPNQQNNCKASVLDGATRILRDLFAQVESLKKENAALVSESHYITLERDEMKNENSTLQAEISELQHKLQENMHTGSAWSNNMDINSSVMSEMRPMLIPVHHQPLITEPVRGAPIRELQLFPESTTPIPPTSPRPSNVRRPQAICPTQPESWQSHYLSAFPWTAQEEPCSSSINTMKPRDES